MVRLAPSPRDGQVGMTRAALLRRGGVAVTALATGVRAPYAFAGPLRHSARQLSGSLSIVQWTHVIGGFDTWFNGWAKDWGASNDVEVEVDHMSITRLPALVASEAAAQKGHDIVGFLAPPTAYEDQVIDHGTIVRAVERIVGPYSALGQQSTYNPRRGTYFGISDKTGSVSIPAVPDGKYELHVWYERSQPEALKPLKRTVQITGDSRDLGTIVVPQDPGFSTSHKNKYGQDYAPPPGQNYPH